MTFRVWNVEWEVCSLEVGVESVEGRVCSAECGAERECRVAIVEGGERSAAWEVGSVKWNAECGVWIVGCGARSAECEM